jgi:hypothetical protein
MIFIGNSQWGHAGIGYWHWHDHLRFSVGLLINAGCSKPFLF